MMATTMTVMTKKNRRKNVSKAALDDYMYNLPFLTVEFIEDREAQNPQLTEEEKQQLIKEIRELEERRSKK